MKPYDAARPLAAASLRLRKRPGRPRKLTGAPALEASAPSGDARGGLPGQAVMGQAGANVPANVPAPRLLDLAGAAHYLSLSVWSIRTLEASGILRRVRVPLPGNGELRKVLFDREDLDRLVERSKEGV